jgi:hypothetical protein
MLRVADPAEPLGYHLEYSVEFRRATEPDTAWQALLTGRFMPAGGVRRGRGQIRLDRGPGFAAGYPVKGKRNDPKDEMLVLEIEYQRIDYPIIVTARIQNVPGADSPGGAYAYVENSDHAGAMSFRWRDDANILATAVEIISRWDKTGAGRADARVVEGIWATFTGVSLIDCWGPDASATFELRRFGMTVSKMTGVEGACVFGPP